MQTTKRNSESEIISFYEIALSNAMNQEEIFSSISELGLTKKSLEQGLELLNQTKVQMDENRIEDDETRESSENYRYKSQLIYDKFLKDRKKAKVIFRKDPLILQQLGINELVSKSWVGKMNQYERFYQTINSNPKILSSLKRLKILQEDIQSGLNMLEEAKNARKDYYREVGESEQTTKDKDLEFAKLDDWMSEFFAITKIALEEKPQLLESLGKMTKS